MNSYFKSRLSSYHNLIGKFDLLNKYNLPILRFKSLKSLSIFYSVQKYTKTNLNFLLLRELLFCRRFGLRNSSKYLKAGVKYFRLTLRKNLLFLYLELLLNIYFLQLKVNYKFIVLNSFIEIKILYDNIFFHMFKLKFNTQKIPFSTRINLNSLNDQLFIPSYYFIPETIRRVA